MRSEVQEEYVKVHLWGGEQSDECCKVVGDIAGSIEWWWGLLFSPGP